MKNIFLHKVIPIFIALIVLTGCLVMPASAATSSDTITFNGQFSEDEAVFVGYNSDDSYNFYLVRVSASVPTPLELSNSAPNYSFDFFLDNGEWVSFPYDNPVLTVVDSRSFYFLDKQIVFFADSGLYTFDGITIEINVPGTYFLCGVSDITGRPLLYVSSLTVPGFDFHAVSYNSHISMYENIYNTLAYFLFAGSSSLTTHMELTLTILATTACVFVVILPFLIVYAFFKRWL